MNIKKYIYTYGCPEGTRQGRHFPGWKWFPDVRLISAACGLRNDGAKVWSVDIDSV